MASQTKPIVVELCAGTNCTFRGAGNLLHILQSETQIAPYCDIQEISCLDNLCDHAKKSPVVRINDEVFEQASPEVILDALYTRIEALGEKDQ